MVESLKPHARHCEQWAGGAASPSARSAAEADRWRFLRQKTALARTLIEQAKQALDAPVDRYVLLDEARHLAAAAADFATATIAVEALAESFDVKPLLLKSDALQTMAKSVKLPAQHKEIGNLAARMSEEALAADDCDAAQELNVVAVASLRKARDTQAVKRLLQFAKDIDRRRALHAEALAGRQTLLTAPEDQAANLAVGQFLSLVQHDWEQSMQIVLKTSAGPVRMGGSISLLDEVALFNRALLPAEIRRLYQLGKSRRPVMLEEFQLPRESGIIASRSPLRAPTIPSSIRPRTRTAVQDVGLSTELFSRAVFQGRRCPSLLAAHDSWPS